MDTVLTSQIQLFSVAESLGEKDLKYLKFLVADMNGIDRQRLDSARAIDFILMLKERNGGDMSLFGEMLRVIGRNDLCGKLKTYFDTQTSFRLPEVKVLMFHLAQSMTEENLQCVRFLLEVNREDCSDAIELMKLIETRKAVASREDLRQVTNEFDLSHLFDKALNKRGDVVLKGKEAAKQKPVISLARMPSFCDETGCGEGCQYRRQWLDKFPHSLTPVFGTERLLNHDDLSADDEISAEELLVEGAFGKIYKGQ